MTNNDVLRLIKKIGYELSLQDFLQFYCATQNNKKRDWMKSLRAVKIVVVAFIS